MSLSCSCSDGGDWWYFQPKDFARLDTKRGRKCCSCGASIKVGETVLQFECFRAPCSDIEERICGDEVRMADRFLCEECGDLFMSITELGFCVYLGSDMHELVKQYAEVYGPAKLVAA